MSLPPEEWRLFILLDGIRRVHFFNPTERMLAMIAHATWKPVMLWRVSSVDNVVWQSKRPLAPLDGMPWCLDHQPQL